MRGFDAFAGVIKSGGKTRRAAKMVILERRPSGHHGVHPLQGRRGEEGLVADRRRLRRRLQRARRRLRLGLLPERQPLGSGHRRLHAGRRGGRRVLGDQGRHHRRGRRRIQGARTPARDGRGRTRICGDPGIQYDTTINRWNPVKARGGSIRATRARSTCSSTTRPATWPAST